jgi:hypothetical protein
MKNWPKEDRYSWEKSEVMKEFESRILSNYSKVEKIAQQKMSIPEVKALGQELQKANVAAKELKHTLTSAADDGQDMAKDHQCDSAEDCAVCQMNNVSDSDYSDDEVKMAKSKILDELYKMADDAIASRDIKLAYRIERTIAEIEENDND